MAGNPRRVAITMDLEWPHKRHAAVFAGCQQYAQQQDWETIIDEYAEENLPTRQGKPAPYDGIIGRASKKLCDRAKRLDVPLVNVWFTSPVWEQLPGVFPDFIMSGRLQAEHLLARGLRHFAALSREDHGSKVELDAFQAVVREEGHHCTTVNLPLHPTRTFAMWQKSEKRILAWMEKWKLPIGVLIYGEEVGRMVAQMCHRRGLRVPQDVAIITGSNEVTLCEHPRPSLSSVERGYERIGYEAAKLLDQLMQHKENGTKQAEPVEHIFLPPQGMVVRESTDFYAVEDELMAAALEYIAANSHKRIGPDEVARAVSMERRTLQNRFRKYLDRPIAAEIRRVRIERAKRELAQSKRPLAEIAHDVGFGESMRMYEVFRRELGVTPGQYRKQRQLQENV